MELTPFENFCAGVGIFGGLGLLSRAASRARKLARRLVNGKPMTLSEQLATSGAVRDREPVRFGAWH